MRGADGEGVCGGAGGIMGFIQKIFSRIGAGYFLAAIGIIIAIYTFISLIQSRDFLAYIFNVPLFSIGTLIILFGVYLRYTKRPDERVAQLFNQIKETKNCIPEGGEPLIDPARGLMICNLMPGYYCLPLVNRIFYNENSTTISDNAIRFSLLHEEGHFREVQSNVIIGYFRQIVFTGLLCSGFLSGISFLIFITLFIGGNFEKGEMLIIVALSGILFVIFFLQTILFFLIWLMTTRTFQTPLQMDELSSDAYAAKALRDCFGVEKPSLYLREVLEDIFKDFKKIYGKKRSFYRKMQYVFKGGTHPSIEDRVEKIEKYIDKKSS